MLVPVILASGEDERLRSDLPAVLHPLLGVPMLEHLLETLEAVEALSGDPGRRPREPQDRDSSALRGETPAGLPGEGTASPRRQLLANVVVVVGPIGEQVKQAFPGRGIIWVVEETQRGTAHAAFCGVEAAADLLSGASKGSGPGTANVLILEGVLPLLRPETLEGLLSRHLASEADVTVLVCEGQVPASVGRSTCGEKIGAAPCIFRIPAFRESYRGLESVPGTAPPGGVGLSDLIAKAAQAGRKVVTSPVCDATEVARVDSRSAFARVSEVLRSRLLEEHMARGVTIYDPRSTYIEKGVRIGQDTRILPFTMIERGVEIGRRCDIGPFTHLRPGTQLAEGVSIGNFVEVKNSRLGQATKVRHLSYVGDGIIGEDVNIGAGTIFANYDGRVKNTSVVEDGASVGSGTILVAPVTIGKRATTGAGAVVLKNRHVPAGAIALGIPARVRFKDASP